MPRNKKFIVATALAALIGVPAVLAKAPGAKNEVASDSAAATNPGEESPSPARLESFETAKTTMADAIKAAEQEAAGNVFDVDFDDQGTGPVFIVDITANGAITEYRIDANSGRVIGQGDRVPADQLDPEDQAAIGKIGVAGTDLSQAIKSAEEKFGGKAIDAGLAEDDGETVYEVVLVNGGRFQHAMVDPKTGAVASLQAMPGRYGSSTSK